MIEYIQILLFIIGTILIIFAGDQDEKTRKPILIIPALFFLGLSANFVSGLLILLIGLICFLFLPKQVNKVMGKADIFLFGAIIVLLIFSNSLLTVLTWITLTIMLIQLTLFERKNKNTKKTKPIPLISYYSKAYQLAIIIFLLLTITMTTLTIIGVI